MARQPKHHTLSEESHEYLKQFKNESQIIDQALELHRNKDKIVMNEPKKELKKVVIEI